MLMIRRGTARRWAIAVARHRRPGGENDRPERDRERPRLRRHEHHRDGGDHPVLTAIKADGGGTRCSEIRMKFE